jgi:opacity protein-like surface antigen
VQLKVYTEIGGFPTVGFKFTDHFSLEAGYRWLDMDYSTGDGTDRFVYDVLTQGPIGGLAFRF